MPEENPQRRRVRVGSDASTGQIKRSVIHGRRVDLYSYAEPKSVVASGYVCGMDDYHWLIADTDRNKVVLVHKSAAFVVLHRADDAIDHEPETEWLTSVVKPFQEWCRNDRDAKKEQTC